MSLRFNCHFSLMKRNSTEFFLKNMYQALSLNLDGDLCLNIQLQQAHKQATRATTKKRQKVLGPCFFFYAGNVCWLQNNNDNDKVLTKD